MYAHQTEQVQARVRYNELSPEKRRAFDEYYRVDHPHNEAKSIAFPTWEKREQQDAQRYESGHRTLVTGNRPGNRNCQDCGGTCWIQRMQSSYIVCDRCPCFIRQGRI